MKFKQIQMLTANEGFGLTDDGQPVWLYVNVSTVPSHDGLRTMFVHNVKVEDKRNKATRQADHDFSK